MRPTRLLAVGLYTSHGALAILPAVLPALSAAGFTPAGIAAGSIAAGVQSTIGNVAAGSLFATLQSAGMGGYGVTVLHAAAQAGAAGAAGGFAGGSVFCDKGKGDGGEGRREGRGKGGLGRQNVAVTMEEGSKERRKDVSCESPSRVVTEGEDDTRLCVS